MSKNLSDVQFWGVNPDNYYFPGDKGPEDPATGIKANGPADEHLGEAVNEY